MLSTGVVCQLLIHEARGQQEWRVSISQGRDLELTWVLNSLTRDGAKMGAWGFLQAVLGARDLSFCHPGSRGGCCRTGVGVQLEQIHGRARVECSREGSNRRVAGPRDLGSKILTLAIWHLKLGNSVSVTRSEV